MWVMSGLIWQSHPSPRRWGVAGSPVACALSLSFSRSAFMGSAPCSPHSSLCGYEPFINSITLKTHMLTTISWHCGLYLVIYIADQLIIKISFHCLRIFKHFISQLVNRLNIKRSSYPDPFLWSRHLNHHLFYPIWHFVIKLFIFDWCIIDIIHRVSNRLLCNIWFADNNFLWFNYKESLFPIKCWTTP